MLTVFFLCFLILSKFNLLDMDTVFKFFENVALICGSFENLGCAVFRGNIIYLSYVDCWVYTWGAFNCGMSWEFGGMSHQSNIRLHLSKGWYAVFRGWVIVVHRYYLL